MCRRAGSRVDYYTELYVRLTGADRERSYSDAYKQRGRRDGRPVERRASSSSRTRNIRTSLTKANKEIADAEQKYQDGLAEYNTQKADAEQKLDDACGKARGRKAADRQDGWKRDQHKRKPRSTSRQQQYESGLAAYNQGVSDYRGRAKHGCVCNKVDASRSIAQSDQIAACCMLNAAAFDAARRSADPDYGSKIA